MGPSDRGPGPAPDRPSAVRSSRRRGLDDRTARRRRVRRGAGNGPRLARRFDHDGPHPGHEPIPIGDRDVQFSSSIGIAVWPEDGNSLDNVLVNADIAVRCQAEASRPVVRFDPVMAAEGAAHRQLARALRIAMRLPDENFYLEYQPQVDMRTGSMVAAEALVRWRDASGRMIPLMEFIPMAGCRE